VKTTDLIKENFYLRRKKLLKTYDRIKIECIAEMLKKLNS
jgi:hypothetical protein